MGPLARVCTALVFLPACIVLVGWFSGVTALTTVDPAHPSMRPMTAVAFVMLAAATAVLRRGRLAVALAGAAVAIGVVSLAEHVLGRSLGVDTLLPGIDFHGGSARMAPATALTLVLLGAAIVAGARNHGAVMRAIGLVSFGISQVALLGYVYGVSALYTVGSATAMAPHTAVCLVLLSLSILLHDPSAGLVGLLRDTGSAGRLLRPLVPTLLLGPLLLGWLQLKAQDENWLGTRSGVVALVMAMTVLGAGVSWRAAVRLRELDRQRDEAQRVLAETNRSLDATVQERTHELADRASFTNAMLETVDVGIVWCDVNGAHLRNRAQRIMVGLPCEAQDLPPDHAAALMDVADHTGAKDSPEAYSLTRALNGEDIGEVDLTVGPSGGPFHEVVLKGSQIHNAQGELLGAVVVLTDVTTERTTARSLAAERDRLTEAQRLGQLGGFECDFGTDVWKYSEQMYDLWGVESGGLSSEIIETLIVEADRELADASWADAMRLGGRHIQEFRIRRAADGAERVLRATLEVDLGPDDRALRVRGTHLDITDLTVAEKAAQRANAFFDAVLAATPDFTFVSDLVTDEFVYVSRDKDILGMDTATMGTLGPEARAALIHPEDQPRLHAINIAAAGLRDGQVLQLRYRARHADGQWRWLSRRITPFRRDASGVVVEVLGVARDISDVMESEARLTHAALHDSLTGLPNRALLIDRLEAALARSARDGREVAVLFCDLDGFKRVNDLAGHAAGDAVLLEIAGRFHEVLREYDTIARVGGDEFVVIVEPWNRADSVDATEPRTEPAPGVAADRRLAVQVAERIALALQQPVTVMGVDHVVSASIGITYATLGPGGRTGVVTAEQVLQDADTAMYLAKGRGKDRFEIFEHGHHTDLAERGRVEQLLRQALNPTALGGVADGAARPKVATFAAAYQPVFDSGTGRLTGFEALARLTDGDGLSIAPDVFIPVAEETGVIHRLGRAMLGLACGQLTAWRAEIPGLENVSMAVNVSALQAQHASLADDVHHALATHQLDPCDLVLELTETALLQVANSTITALRALRAEGVGIAIDDFGIGYASLRYLATLPVSAVKVDRSFTAGLTVDETSRKIVKAVAALAADMGLTCIVEGVETAEQRAALPEGVYLQGYLTGRPQRPEDMDVLALCIEGAR